MAQCISRRAARSRRPETLKEDLAQVPFFALHVPLGLFAELHRGSAMKVFCFVLRRWWLVRANTLITWSLCGKNSRGRPIRRKVGPELENYLKVGPSFDSEARMRRFTRERS